MVRARLHIICGNCGSNDDWQYEIVENAQDFGDYFKPDTYLWCGNCATLHPISSYMPEKERTKP
jgi:uncharacterized Zn finger protein